MIGARMLALAPLAVSVWAPCATAQSRLLAIDGSNLLEVDPATGATLQTIPITGLSGMSGELTYDPLTDTLFLSTITNPNLWTLDRHTGVATLIGPFNTGSVVWMYGLEVDDTGQLYGYGWDDGVGYYYLYSIDRSTGQATQISWTPLFGFASLAFVAATQTMYISDTIGDKLWTIDRSSGALALVGPLIPSPNQFVNIGAGLAFDPAFGLYARNNWAIGTLYTVDLATGAATYVGAMNTGADISLVWVSGDPQPIPTCFGDGSGAPCPCSNSGAPGHGCANSSDPAGAVLDSVGYAWLANDTLVLTSSHEYGPALSVFLQGSVQIAPLPFGDGLRCAGGVLKRLYVHNASLGSVSAPTGSDVSISVRSAALGDPLAPGAQRVMQVYYRDPSPSFCPSPTGDGFNISNALLVTWN